MLVGCGLFFQVWIHTNAVFAQFLDPSYIHEQKISWISAVI